MYYILVTLVCVPFKPQEILMRSHDFNTSFQIISSFRNEPFFIHPETKQRCPIADISFWGNKEPKSE